MSSPVFVPHVQFFLDHKITLKLNNDKNARKKENSCWNSNSTHLGMRINFANMFPVTQQILQVDM